MTNNTFIDMRGRRYGRLTVVSYEGSANWLCLCECGSHTVVFGPNIRKGL